MKKDSFEKKIAAYVTLAAAYMAAHPVDADAQIMYTDVNPDLVIHNGFFNLDLNNDGVVDFKLHQGEGNAVDAFGSDSWAFAGVTPFNNNEIVGDTLLASSYSLCFGNPSALQSGSNIGLNQAFVTGGDLKGRHHHDYF